MKVRGSMSPDGLMPADGAQAALEALTACAHAGSTAPARRPQSAKSATSRRLKVDIRMLLG
jgi:hypothetical protein